MFFYVFSTFSLNYLLTAHKIKTYFQFDYPHFVRLNLLQNLMYIYILLLWSIWYEPYDLRCVLLRVFITLRHNTWLLASSGCIQVVIQHNWIAGYRNGCFGSKKISLICRLVFYLFNQRISPFISDAFCFTSNAFWKPLSVIKDAVIPLLTCIESRIVINLYKILFSTPTLKFSFPFIHIR